MDTSRKGKPNKNHSDYGMADYYKFYSKKYHPLGKQYEVNNILFNEIVSEYNTKIAEFITDDVMDFIIPFQLGVLGVRKYKPSFSIDKSGKILNRLPVNPIETAKLWEKDPQAKANKTFVRYTNKHSNGYVFSIYYFRGKAKFKNKQIYVLTPKRTLKRRVSRNVKENLIDAFLLKQN
jgi:hypothetical protein